MNFFWLGESRRRVACYTRWRASTPGGILQLVVAECRYINDGAYAGFDLQSLTDDEGNVLLPKHTNVAPTGGVPVPANCVLNDGLSSDDTTLGGSGITNEFPYIGIPHSSYGVSGL